MLVPSAATTTTTKTNEANRNDNYQVKTVGIDVRISLLFFVAVVVVKLVILPLHLMHSTFDLIDRKYVRSKLNICSHGTIYKRGKIDATERTKMNCNQFFFLLRIRYL